MLFLETGELPLQNVISVRLLYFHTIISRDENKIINKVYMAIKENPIKGDWIKLIRKDLEVIEISLEYAKQIKIMSTK